MAQLALPLVAAVMYGLRARTLSARGAPVPRWRIAAFYGGVVLFAVALTPPLEHRAEELFVFHMIQHVLLGDLAPLLFVLGLTGPLLRPLLALRPVAALKGLAHPLVALPLWTLNLYVWHVPYLYESAVRNDAVHALEHISFFTAGALMWAAVIEVLPGPAWFGTAAKLGYVVAVRLLETVLGNVFLWAGTPHLRRLRRRIRAVRPLAAARPGPGGHGDDDRGLAGHARGDRVALPALGRGERAAPAADRAGCRRARGRPGGALRAWRGTTEFPSQ